jgi:hypothetical protein
MVVEDVAPGLQERLGPEATDGLLALFETARRDWTGDVIATTGERFERRLTHELGLVRGELSALGADLREEMKAGFVSVREEMRDLRASLREEIRDGDAALLDEIRQGDAALRDEIRQGDAGLRDEIRQGDAGLRDQIRDVDAALRVEMRELAASLREDIRNSDSRHTQELASLKFELLKWSFGFWVGQAIATIGIVGVMFQLMRP